MTPRKIDDYLNQRGFFARIFRGLFKTIDASWKMYPIGFLFGLGFDTATEIGLFVLAGTVGSLHLPLYAAFLLPLLFTAGMCLADTTDGVMMLGAYGWAFVKPIRKLFYNMSITLISVLVALVIGTIEVVEHRRRAVQSGGTILGLRRRDGRQFRLGRRGHHRHVHPELAALDADLSHQRVRRDRGYAACRSSIARRLNAPTLSRVQAGHPAC